jgi:hypothetical protein
MPCVVVMRRVPARLSRKFKAVSRTRCGVQRCTADPGSSQTQRPSRSRVGNAALRFATCRIAPGKGGYFSSHTNDKGTALGRASFPLSRE